MADGGSYTKPQRLVSPATAPNKKNPSKFYSHFLFKALIVAIFLVIIPIFPSEAPDFVAPSSFFTRGWELLHLIFVGIAVSYGLFSRRNDESEERENNSKIDNAQSYVSRLLQVPSVFDDEVDTPSGSDDNINHSNENKVQTWSSQYYRNEPMLVVANKESSVVAEKSGIREKPLLLPVRSLKSRVSDGNDDELVNEEDSGVSRVYTRSNSTPTSNGFSNNLRRMSRNDVGLVNGENSGVSRAYTRSISSPREDGFVNNSRRMSRNGSVKSMKSQGSSSNEFGYVNEDVVAPGSLSRSNSRSSSSSKGFSGTSRKPSSGDLDDENVEEKEEKIKESVVLPSPIPWRSRSGRMEVKGELDDSNPFSLEETRSFKSQSSGSNSNSPKKLSPSPSLSSPKKLSPSSSLSQESLAKRVEDVGRRRVVYRSSLPPPPPPPPPPPTRRSQLVKSSSRFEKEEISSRQKELNRSVWNEPKEMGRGNREEIEANARNSVDGSLVGKSVRTVRGGEAMATRKTRGIKEEGMNDMVEGRRSNEEVDNSMAKSSFSEYSKETRDFFEQFLVATDDDDDSESEDENYVEHERVEDEKVEDEKIEEPPANNVNDEGPDVDKKADEFIAKFREQIRLQRIESIKRSAGQLKRNSVR